jgi:hypothetical protein
MLYALTPGGKRLLAVSVAAVLALLAIGFAATSDASAAYDHCGAGNVCAYRDSGGRCNIYYFSGNDSSWMGDSSEFGCGRSGDAASSTWNNGSANGGHYEDVIFWTGTGYTGNGFCEPRGWYTIDLAGTAWQDHIRSHQWTYSHCNPNVVYSRSAAAAPTMSLRSESVALPQQARR